MFRKIKNAFINVIIISISVCILFIFLEIFLRFMPIVNSVNWVPITQEDKILRHSENSEITYSKDWNFKYSNTRRVNNYGFLNDQNYTSNPSTSLIAVIGDSYVEAMLNKYENTFYGKLEKHLSGNSLVYSFGVSGAQLSQYIAWIDYTNKEFNPELFIIPIIANDFDESFYKYKRTRGFHYFNEHSLDGTIYSINRVDSKFRRILLSSSLFRYVFFHLRAGDLLKKTKNIIVKKYNNDKTEARYIGNVVAEVSRQHELDGMIATDLFFKKLEKIIKPNQKVIFILDAVRPSIYSPQSLIDSENSFWSKMRVYFSNHESMKNFTLIDMQDYFIKHYNDNELKFEYKTDGHWNDLAHSLVFKNLINHKYIYKYIK